jgi:acyl-coenzyme A synthetase/AMP-(fatty) acid ligase
MAHARVQTLADVLKGNSDAPGVICAGGGPAFTRGQLEEKIQYVANLLRNSGIKVGDTVSIAKANTVCLSAL